MNFTDLIARANSDCEHLSRLLLGEPNKRLSSRTALRWGNHGRLVVTTAGTRQGKWRNWSSGDHGDMLDLVQAETGRDKAASIEWLHAHYGGTDEPMDRRHFGAARRAADAEESRLRARRQSLASDTWNRAEPLAGSIADRYLQGRLHGVGVPASVYEADAIRWSRRDLTLGAVGCMVALMTDPITGAPTGVHRTYLTNTGEKVGRKMLGVKGVVRLWPDDAVTTGLSVGEGIETTLSGALLFDAVPAWAALDAGNLACFAPVPGIDALTILADNDEPAKNGRQAGQEAAAECADRWRSAGHEVTIRTPRVAGSDFNDLLRLVAEQKAA